LGCKLNQAEIDLLAGQVAEAGYRLVSSADKADIYILNTCTVTHIADRKSRHWLRQAHRQNPDARVVAIGCYAEWAPQELAQIDGVDVVLGNEQKPYLLQRLWESRCLSRPPSVHQGGASRYHNGYRTRAFIKVQDGCRDYCAYCIVPLVRGSEKSEPVDRVVAEVRQLVADGAKEVVLTGTKLGSYKYDGVNLEELLKHILAETDVTRLRLSSLQPQEISSGVIGLWHNRRLCPHFHLSLQSGSDDVLDRMKRHYTTADYRQAISLLREVVPEAAITTDVIVGFPGETDLEFQESYDFCRKMEFARIHVFSYSSRRGTAAAQMPNQIKDGAKKKRNQKMLTLAKESAQNFSRRFLGRTVLVLWEKQAGGIWSGLTDNYIKVYTDSNSDLTNQLLSVTLMNFFNRDGVWGRVVSCSPSPPDS
jgi:threonylcarbamoyladenosine tRNA methylthiotransferase MtaB